AEERRDVDEDRVEEEVELFRLLLEVGLVCRVVLELHLLHALRDAPHEARSLVPGEVEAALVADEIEQRLECRIAVVACAHATFASWSSASSVCTSPSSSRSTIACSTPWSARSANLAAVRELPCSRMRSAIRRCSATRSSSARSAVQSAISTRSACALRN